MTKLYHFSEQPGLREFNPRPSASGEELVWAIAESHQQNYLLPRDCPRICIHARHDTSQADIAHFLVPDTWRIIVERAWMNRIRTTTMYKYEFDARGFEMRDEIAGYFTTDQPQTPLSVTKISDLPAAIASTGAVLSSQASLVDLAEGVARSSLGFSMIRMRNAAHATAS